MRRVQVAATYADERRREVVARPLRSASYVEVIKVDAAKQQL